MYYGRYSYNMSDNVLMEKINALEKEIEQLRYERGEFGFFVVSPLNTLGVDKLKKIKNELTVEEFELVSTFNMNYPIDAIRRATAIINKLCDKGLLDAANYDWEGVYGAPQYSDPVPYIPTPAPVPYPNDNIPTQITQIKQVERYDGEFFEIIGLPQYADKAHEIFKGSVDYIESNVVLEKRERDFRITVCVDLLKNPTEVKVNISKVLGLLFKNEEASE